MRLLLSFSFMLLSAFCSGQDGGSIYQFMNNGLPGLEVGKSDWGIFHLEAPFVITNSICQKILDADWDKADLKLRDEFYERCAAMNIAQQQQFRWVQAEFHKGIIVADTKHKIPLSKARELPLEASIKNKASYWIKQWNKSKIEDRLINYSSIPIFSADKKYVLILRGQDVRSEGGWDTIYIYKKEEKKWTAWKTIRVTEI
ncbi:MAG TPA: hypothetical protein VFR70_06655 [Flavobacterium sp.]|nr:hypothetical protein [Flavobacterium sp.]